MVREENCDPTLNVVSATTLGSLCTYILEFGTPYQKEKTLALKDYIHEKIKETEISLEKGTQKEVDWKDLRQRLYSISGDWLWLHATNHWKLKVASQIIIRPELIEKALYVEQSDIKKHDFSSGSFASTEPVLKIDDGINMKEYDNDDRISYFESDNSRLQYKETDIVNNPNLLEGTPL